MAISRLPGKSKSRIRPISATVSLEASTETLLRRFSETRRPHPLSGEGRVVDGINTERELLAEIRGHADMVLDTSAWSIHEIRSEIYRRFGGQSGRGGKWRQ